MSRVLGEWMVNCPCLEGWVGWSSVCPWLSWRLPCTPTWGTAGAPSCPMYLRSSEKAGKEVSELSWEDIVWVGINSNCCHCGGKAMHSVNKHVLSTYCAPCIVLAAGNTAVNKADRFLCSWG